MKNLLLLFFALALSGCCGIRNWVECDTQCYTQPALIVESDSELNDVQKRMVRWANPGTVIIFKVRPRIIVIPEGAF